MNTNPSKTLLVAAFLFVFVSVARSTNHANHLHAFNPTAFCEHTAPFKSLCTKAVHSAHGFSMTSPVMVVEASVNMAVEKAERALKEVSFLSSGRRKSYPGMTGSVLHSCKENYDSTVDSLRKTMRILSTHGSHDDLMTELTAACTFIDTCTDDLETVPEMKYPIQRLHTSVEHLVRNCLDLAYVLK